MAVSVKQIEAMIEKAAPRSWAEDWDNAGLLVGSSDQKVYKILLSLDATMEVALEAADKKASLLITHHPLLFKPLNNLRSDNPGALIPLTLFKNGISLYTAHTNLDQSRLSSSRTFAGILELNDTEYLTETVAEKLYKLVVFVPEDQAGTLRGALAAEGVGAGITGGRHSENYAECFFQTAGEGMFRALPGAEPAIGRIGDLTRLAEIRMESIVNENNLSRAVKALKKAHPYEEPAFDVIPLQNKGRARGYGIIGELGMPVKLEELWEHFLQRLKENCCNIFPDAEDVFPVRIAGDPKQKIKRVAIANGSGTGFVSKAISKRADLYITGEIDYHGLLDSLETGMAVGELGHYLSEIPMLRSLYDLLSKEKGMDGVQILFSGTMKNPWQKRG